MFCFPSEWYWKENMNASFPQIFPKCHKEIGKHLKIYKLFQSSASYKTQANTPFSFGNGSVKQVIHISIPNKIY